MPTVVPAATRTMLLLEVFARERRELSNSDLARLMDLPESSCSDLLYTLHDMGETGLCGHVVSGVVHVLAFAEGTHPLRYVSNVGNKIALHVSALGKAELSLGTPEEAARQLRLKTLKQIAPGSITDLAVLENQVAQAREQGWSWVENEGFDGLAAMAVAGYVGDQPLAISVAGPTQRLRANKEACLQALKEVQSLVFHARDGSAPQRAISARRGVTQKVTGPA